MKRLKAAGLGLMASAAVVVSFTMGLAASSQVSAQGEAVSVSRVTVAPRAQATVDLVALDMHPPGLGAWEIDIIYDPAVVMATACSPRAGSVCNAQFARNTVRVTGASASGHVGDTTLASITFRCDEEGSSALILSLGVLADATIGGPQDIDAATQHGTVDCIEPTGLSPSPVPVASPTPSASVAGVSRGPGLPGAGSAGVDGGSGWSWVTAGLAGAGIAWLIAGVAIAGLAAVTSFGAIRLAATGNRREADGPVSFVPRMKARRTSDSGRPRFGGTTDVLTSSPGRLADTGTNGGGSVGRTARRWLVAAREDLAGTKLARMAAFRLPRRRGPRS